MVNTKSAELNAAMRRGVPIETKKKFTGGKNVSANRPNLINAAEIEAEIDVVPPPRVDFNTAVAIQRARAAKGLTQVQLAKIINVKSSVIGDYENGKAIPIASQIAAIERALGTKLPRPPKKPTATETTL